MIDLHAHILPGFDDGVGSLEQARDLARRAAAQGVTAIAATPHVRDDYPTTAEQMERGVLRLRADFLAEAIPIEVLHGGEIGFDQLDKMDDAELGRFSLAQSGRYLLVEPPYSGWPLGLERSVHSLRRRGFSVVLGHPERNGAVHSSPERLRSLVEAGVLVQLTAASLAGTFGRQTLATARALLDSGLAHLVASDAHGSHVRPFQMAEGAAAVRDEALRSWLTEHVPAAIVAGDPPPPRPERPARGRIFPR